MNEKVMLCQRQRSEGHDDTSGPVSWSAGKLSTGSPPIMVDSISTSSLLESAPDLLVSSTAGVTDVGPYHDATSSNTTSQLTHDYRVIGLKHL